MSCTKRVVVFLALKLFLVRNKISSRAKQPFHSKAMQLVSNSYVYIDVYIYICIRLFVQIYGHTLIYPNMQLYIRLLPIVMHSKIHFVDTDTLALGKYKEALANIRNLFADFP